MVKGDEGKPMSIGEFISDEPCDPEPYVEYLLENWRGTRDYWQAKPNDRDPDKPTTRECVLSKISQSIWELENLLRKMHRPQRQDLASPREETEP